MADDPKAKDILKELPRRRTPGERLLARLGERRDSAPGHARRKRLFERLGQPDPWDPTAKPSNPALGQVALKLADRRRPAPHAQIRDPKKKDKQNLAPRGVPKAPPRPKEPPKESGRKTASAPAAVKQPPKAAELPPGIDPAIQRRLEAQARAKKERQELEAARQEEVEAQKATRGRFRMKRTKATGPKSRPVPRDLPKKKDEPPPPRDTAPARRVPGGNSGGLDDLFGFSNEPRVRLTRPKKDDTDKS